VVFDHVDVTDNRVDPVPVVVQDAPLINCDPLRPNGQLSATADSGLIGGYTFDWYSGSTVSGAILMTENILRGQSVGTYTTYTVRVTNNMTGCFEDANGEIKDGTVDPPIPDAVVERNMAHCKFPDGWVSASVDGVTLGYSFDWYDGSTVSGTPFNGVNYTGLDVGFYTVTVMDVNTGCSSDPATVEVLDERVFPEIVFTTTASFCSDVPDLTEGTGTAEIQLVPADALVDDAVWTLYPDTTIVVGQGSYVDGLFPGQYAAKVETAFGCPGFGFTEIPTEVRPYNLVTSNNDAKNDAFVVDCISSFPNNNVKIFNRAGVKVFEMDGYNNVDRVFTGIGKIGVYAVGNELPVGTYFYIIDKRDGSKPKTGYIELVK
jgi:hypothetical protein